MSNTEFDEYINYLKYFWKEKGDIRRFAGFEAGLLELKARRPDLYLIIESYHLHLDAMNRALYE